MLGIWKPVPPIPLTTDELYEVSNTLTRVCEGYLEFTGFAELLEYCDGLNPLVMFLEGVNGQLTDDLFKGRSKDVLLGITNKLFMVIGGAPMTNRIAITLAEGLCLDGPNTEISLLPEGIRSTMPLHSCRENAGDVEFSSEDVASLLVSNKHLIVVLLLHIFNVVESTEEKL